MSLHQVPHLTPIVGIVAVRTNGLQSKADFTWSYISGNGCGSRMRRPLTALLHQEFAASKLSAARNLQDIGCHVKF